MDFSRSAEDQELLDKVVALQPGIRERARAYDDAAAFPEKDFEEFRKLGLHTMAVPKEYGGMGMWRDDRYRIMYDILESVAWAHASTGQSLQIQCHATGIIGWIGNEEQKQRYLAEEVVKNGKLIASCGTETNPQQLKSKELGSGGTSTDLVAVDGGFRLNCVKHFGSLAPAADYYLLYVLAPNAPTSTQGMTIVVVHKDDPGVSLVDNWDIMGMRSTISWSVVLEDVFIPWENVIGQPGDWSLKDPRTFTLAYVANHLGTAQGVYDYLLEYMKERPFLQADNVNMYDLGNMAAALQATRMSMWYSCWLWEQGRYAEAEIAGMKALHTSKETGLMVTSKAFDVAGARAAFKHLPIERPFRDVRTFSLHFREAQLLRMLMEAELGGEFRSKQRSGPALPQLTWEDLGIKSPVTV